MMRKLVSISLLIVFHHLSWAQVSNSSTRKQVSNSKNTAGQTIKIKPSKLTISIFDHRNNQPMHAWISMKIVDEANPLPVEVKNGVLEKIFTKPVEIELTAFAKDYGFVSKIMKIDVSPEGETYEFVAVLKRISNSLVVKVIDYETGSQVPQAKIELKNTADNTTQTFTVKADENKEIAVANMGSYEIICSAQGYLLYLTTVEINKEKNETVLKIRRAPKPASQSAVNDEPRKPVVEPKTVVKAEAIKPVETLEFGELRKGKSFTLKNIFFDQSSPVLRSESFAELDKLAEALSKNPAIRIEIRGHTDNTGNFDANVKLSRQRCEAVVHYLTGKGISKSRLEYKGRGPIEAIAPNTTEENKKKNRRVEFIVL